MASSELLRSYEDSTRVSIGISVRVAFSVRARARRAGASSDEALESCADVMKPRNPDQPRMLLPN